MPTSKDPGHLQRTFTSDQSLNVFTVDKWSVKSQIAVHLPDVLESHFAAFRLLAPALVWSFAPSSTDSKVMLCFSYRYCVWLSVHVYNIAELTRARVARSVMRKTGFGLYCSFRLNDFPTGFEKPRAIWWRHPTYFSFILYICIHENIAISKVAG